MTSGEVIQIVGCYLSAMSGNEASYELLLLISVYTTATISQNTSRLPFILCIKTPLIVIVLVSGVWCGHWHTTTANTVICSTRYTSHVT